MMKAIYLLLLYSVVQLSIQEDPCIVYDIKHQDEYTFYYTKGVTDTVVFVAHSDLVKSCRSLAKFINKDNLSTTSELKTKSGYISFTYSAPAISCVVKTVRVSGGQPGENTEYIYTYSSFPYLIEDCSALK
jgi:hypothetical protein